MRRSLSPLLMKLARDAARASMGGSLPGMADAASAMRAAMGLAPALQPGAQPARVAAPFALDGLPGMPRAANRAGTAATARPRPADGSFDTVEIDAGSGPRRYKIFIPASLGSAPAPMVVMLHGCKQDPDDCAAGTRMNELASELGFVAMYPAQAARSNHYKCWNWFEPSDQSRGSGEPALIAAMARDAMASGRIDPDRVYVAGLSAGGAMAAILGREYPDLFAAWGSHSGLPHGSARDASSAFQAMASPRAQPPKAKKGAAPAIVFHGDADRTVHPSNGAATVAGFESASVETRRLDAGGRPVAREIHRDQAGATVAEHWIVSGAGHAWSGGSQEGSFADPLGPDASREMLRFFFEHPRSARRA